MVIETIEPDVLLAVKTDASDIVIAASINQNDKSVVFFLKRYPQALCYPRVTRMLYFACALFLPLSFRKRKTYPRIFRAFKPVLNHHMYYLPKQLSQLRDFPWSLKGHYHPPCLIRFWQYSSPFWLSLCKYRPLTPLLTSLTFPACMIVYIHAAALFTSEELYTFLQGHGIVVSHAAAPCNEQLECRNGTIWRAVNPALKSQSFVVLQW